MVNYFSFYFVFIYISSLSIPFGCYGYLWPFLCIAESRQICHHYYYFWLHFSACWRPFKKFRSKVNTFFVCACDESCSWKINFKWAANSLCYKSMISTSLYFNNFQNQASHNVWQSVNFASFFLVFMAEIWVCVKSLCVFMHVNPSRETIN